MPSDPIPPESLTALHPEPQPQNLMLPEPWRPNPKSHALSPKPCTLHHKSRLLNLEMKALSPKSYDPSPQSQVLIPKSTYALQ